MGKRIGANARKRKTERCGKSRKGLLRAALAVAVVTAVCVAGVFTFNKLKTVFPDIRNFAANFRNTVVDTVRLTGAVHLTPVEIMTRSGIKPPVKYAWLKRDGLAAVRETSPWIETAQLSRKSKGAVTIVIRERKPCAIIPASRSGKLSLVDMNGVCMPMDPHVALDLPFVSGLADSMDGNGRRMLTEGDCGRMVRLFGAAAVFDSSFARRITQVLFAQNRTVRILLSGSATVLLFDEATVAERLGRFAQVWEAVKNDSVPPARIDFSYKNLAFVATQSAAAAPVSVKKTKS